MQNIDELLSSINDAVWSVDISRKKFLYINQRLADIIEKPLNEIAKDPQIWIDHIHPDDKERVASELSRLSKDLKVEVEHRIITSNSVKWVLNKQILLCDLQGNSEILVGIVTDITGKKRTELKLIESEKTYRYLFKNNPNPLWIYDIITLKFLAVNNAAIEKYGYCEKEFLSMTIADINQENVSKLVSAVNKVSNRYNSPEIYSHKKKDGSLIWANISSHSIDYGDRKAEMVLAIDVTEELRIKEDILNKNVRLMEIASLASHDIRGPLMSIVGLTNIFNKDNPADPFNIQVMEHLQKTAEDLDQVIHRIVDKTFKVENNNINPSNVFQHNQ